MTMIRDELVTYEVAKLAKEKGFDWICPHYFRTKNKDLFMVFPCEDWSDIEDRINAPTQSLLQRWLREEKRVVFGISPMQEMDCDYLGWCVTIYKVDKNGYGLSRQEELYYDTYELALENALEYALENLA